MSATTIIQPITSIMVRRILAWWEEHATDGPPDRAQFDPDAFRDLLPNILIADVEPSPFRIRYRLAGTRVIEATGFNIVGRYLDEMLPTEPEAPWQELYYESYRTARPIVGVSECTTTSGGLFAHEYGLFPLRRGGREIVQFLALEDYGDLASTLTDLVQWQQRPSGD